VLAEGGEHVGGAADDEQPRRPGVDEADHVADQVGPQPGAGGERDRVVDAGLDVADPEPGRVRFADLVDRHELEEHAVVGRRAAFPRRAAVGDGDVALRRRVDLARPDLRALEQRVEARLVGREADAAVDDELQVGVEVDDAAGVCGRRLASRSNSTSSQPGAPERPRIARSSESGAIRAIFSSQSVMKRSSRGGKW
jgi:hypothetical protein